MKARLLLLKNYANWLSAVSLRHIYASVERTFCKQSDNRRRRNYRRTGAQERKKWMRYPVPRNRGHNVIRLTRETNLNTDVYRRSFRVVSTQISRSFWKDDFQLVKVHKYFYFSESSRYVLTALNVIFRNIEIILQN